MLVGMALVKYSTVERQSLKAAKLKVKDSSFTGGEWGIGFNLGGSRSGYSFNRFAEKLSQKLLSSLLNFFSKANEPAIAN